MGNRFGITTASNTGDGNNPTVADAPETENTNAQTSNLSFSSVVSSSFNDALSNADSLLKAEKAAPKKDESTAWSVLGNVGSGTVSAFVSPVTSVFKKDKAHLVHQAETGNIAALSEGASVSASFTKTAGDVARAVPALNPLSDQGQKNWSTLGTKYVETWRNGTLDEKARFFGEHIGFGATLLGGTALTTNRTAAVIGDLKGGATVATRALSATDNVAAAANDLRALGRVTEVVTPGVHRFSPAIENATQKTSGLTRFAERTGISNLFENVGQTARKAETLTVAGTENFTSRVNILSRNTPTVLTDAAKVSAETATRNFTSILERTAPKTATEAAALNEVKTAAQALAHGGPEAQTALFAAIKKTGTHADDLTVQANNAIRTINHNTFINVAQTAGKDITGALDNLATTVTAGSKEARAINDIRKLVNEVATTGNKTDDLVQAIKALKNDHPNLNPQVVEGMVSNVSKLETATAGRRLMTGFENAATDVQTAVTELKALEITSTNGQRFMQGSEELKELARVKAAADDLARGVISPERFTQVVDDLKRFPSISPKSIEDITKASLNVTEKSNVASVFSHVDDIVKPVRQAANEVDNVIAAVKASNPQEAAKLQQAVADFVAGRGGNADDLSKAFKAVTNDEAALASVQRFTKTVESARPAMTLEKSFAESMQVLDTAAAKYAATSPQATAIQELRQVFRSAAKGETSLDDLAAAVQRNAKVIDGAVAGGAESLSVNSTKIADAAVDTSRALAIRNGVTEVTQLSDDVVKAAKALETQFAGDAAKVKSLQEVQTAMAGVKNGTHSMDDLNNAFRAAQEAGIKHFDEMASSVNRTARLQSIENSVVKAREASSNIANTTELMEKAARMSDEFQAVDRLRAAVKSGNADDIARVVNDPATKALLEKIQPGVTKQILDDAARVGGNRGSEVVSKLSTKVDEVELAARRASQEFQAIDEVRAAARRVNVDGIGDDLASVLKKNETRLRELEAKVATHIDPKAANLVDNLGSSAKTLGDEAAQVRRLTNVETSSRSVTEVVNSLTQKVDSMATKAAFTSERGGVKLSDDVRALANKVEDAATKQRLIQLADDLQNNAGKFNHVKERLNVIKSLSDDVARGAVKETELSAFFKASRTSLDDVARGSTAALESRVTAIANTNKMIAAENSIAAMRKVPNLSDEAARLGVKLEGEVPKLLRTVDDAAKGFANGTRTYDDVIKATKALEAESKNLAGLQSRIQEIERAAKSMQETRAIAFDAQLRAFDNAASRSHAHNAALNNIANMYDLAPPAVREKLMALREAVLNQQAFILVRDSGVYNNGWLRQKLFDYSSKTNPGTIFGHNAGGSKLVLNAQEGAVNARPVAGIVTSKGQMLDAVERVNNVVRSNQASLFNPVKGLTQDSKALLSQPNLAQEAMRRRLVRDVVLAASGVGIVGVYGNVLYNRAIDTLSEEAMAPYRIAEWMEKEAAAKTEAAREKYHAELTQMIADHIRGKDQDEINALRQQIQAIIAERTSENQQSQAVWSRREKEVLSIGQLRANREHDNQVQYGSAMGPSRGPGVAAVQEAKEVFVAPQQRTIRSNTGMNLEDNGNKRKPATTNFDINKIKEMSNTIGYNQGNLRANPYGTTGPNAVALSPGSTKPWQNVVSWNSGRKYANGSEQGSKGVYGQFKDIEKVGEQDQATGGAVAQAGNGPDPALAAMQVASQQQTVSQDEQNNSAAAV